MECPNFVSVRVVQVVYDCIDNWPSILIINISPPMQQRDIEQPSQKPLSPPDITLAFLNLPKWGPQLPFACILQRLIVQTLRYLWLLYSS